MSRPALAVATRLPAPAREALLVGSRHLTVVGVGIRSAFITGAAEASVGWAPAHWPESTGRMPRSENPLRSELFADVVPNASGMLAVDGRHTLYWEQSGNPDGVPGVFLHGGPGAGSAPVHRRFFDPTFYRIIIFDQRGAGRSLPLGDVVDNTTQHLVEDLEKVRRH